MIIQLDRIVFDHAPGAAADDALSIRIDRANPAPDWIRGAADTSYAAYALVPTLDRQLSIHADFSFPDPLLQPASPVQVRARAVDQDDAILGHVGETPVPPAGGRVALLLQNVQLWTRGTGRYAVSWQWQFRLTANAPWIDLERTDHVVYVTLDEPKAPWSQALGATDRLHWPWARLLDWACGWAGGVKLTSTGASGAAKKILRRLEAALFDQGRRSVVPLQYAGEPAYTREFPDRVFFLTAFLDLLEGTPPPDHGVQVNCSDCASALAALANAMGCDTSLKQIDHSNESSLRSNRIVLIGETDPPETHRFGFHEIVVRERPSDKAPLVHDACLMIDRDEDPTREHEQHDFDLADGMQLGPFVKKPGPYRYAHRFIQPEQWAAGVLLDITFRCLDECIGVPNPPDPGTQRRYQRIRRELDRLPDGQTWLPDLTPPVIQGFALYNRVNSPWRLAGMRKFVSHSAEFFYVATGDGGARDGRLRISMAYCNSSHDAREVLAWLLAQSDAAVSTVRDSAERVGDAAFGADQNAAFSFVRGSAFAQMLHVGLRRPPLAPIGRLMDARIQKLPHRTGRPDQEKMLT